MYTTFPRPFLEKYVSLPTTSADSSPRSYKSTAHRYVFKGITIINTIRQIQTHDYLPLSMSHHDLMDGRDWNWKEWLEPTGSRAGVDQDYLDGEHENAVSGALN